MDNYRAQWDFGKEEFESQVSKYEGRELVELLVSGAFDNATEIVLNRVTADIDYFIGNQIWLSLNLDALKRSDFNQNTWPRSIVFFGQYHLCGRSALGTAWMFADFINDAVLDAKKFVHGNNCIDELEIEQLTAWMNRAHEEINKRFDFSAWPNQVFLRDRNLLSMQLRFELEEILGLIDDGHLLPIVDGPCAPYTWRKNGVALTQFKMPPTAWLLVEYLWRKKEQWVTVDELAEPVFGDHEAYVDAIKLQNHTTRANNFFRKTQLNWSVTTQSSTGLSAILVNQPPK